MRKIVAILSVLMVAAMVSGCVAPQAIQLTRMGGQDMVQRLGTGEIAGYIGWEPYNAEAVVKGDGRVLMSSGEIWAHHPCCIIAYDYNWHQQTDNADDILRRVALVHLRSTEWVNAAKDPNSPNHAKLIQYSVDFTKRDPDVIEKALENIDFDHRTDVSGTTTYIQKLSEYEIFNQDNWDRSGFESPSDYASSLITDEYVQWAMEHEDDPLADLKLDPPATVKIGYLIEDLHQVAFWVAWHEGWFEEVGINIQIAEGAPFQNGAFEMTKGFKLNKVDVGYLGTAPACVHRINSNDFSTDDARINIIAGVNYNGSAIVVGKDVNTMKDLAGQTVGYPGPGTVQHFLFLKAAEEAGIKVAQ